MSHNDVHRAWQLMQDIDICMLVTQRDGTLRSRPMSSIIDLEKQSLHFLTSVKGRLDDEIEQQPHVNLAYSNGSNKLVSVTGTAQVSRDRALIRSLWNVGAQTFWPEGPYDPDVIAIVIQPREAEFWDGDGALIGSAKMAYALATSATPDLGDQKKVSLGMSSPQA